MIIRGSDVGVKLSRSKLMAIYTHVCVVKTVNLSFAGAVIYNINNHNQINK